MDQILQGDKDGVTMTNNNFAINQGFQRTVIESAKARLDQMKNALRKPTLSIPVDIGGVVIKLKPAVARVNRLNQTWAADSDVLKVEVSVPGSRYSATLRICGANLGFSRRPVNFIDNSGSPLDAAPLNARVVGIFTRFADAVCSNTESAEIMLIGFNSRFCGFCGKALTDQKSIAIGLGSECRKSSAGLARALRLEFDDEQLTEKLTDLRKLLATDQVVLDAADFARDLREWIAERSKTK